VRVTHFIEFGLLGLTSGVLAVIIAETLLYALYSKILHIIYQPTWYLWLALPMIGFIVVSITGSWAVRAVANTPPIKVLREG
jgi:putative ABC transport system permease protein